jgi:hypothetical protein
MKISPTLGSILLFGILYNSNPTNTQIIYINTWQLQDGHIKQYTIKGR